MQKKAPCARWKIRANPYFEKSIIYISKADAAKSHPLF